MDSILPATTLDAGAGRTPLLGALSPADVALFGHVPQRFRHSLHQNALFTREALAELIDRYPRDKYSLIHMGAQGETSRRFWQEGDKGALAGKDVIDAIEEGRVWINLRDVKAVDGRYGVVLNRMFAELEAQVPGLHTFTRGMGILISSPKAQVYYHADLPGQSLWQISGVKRVYLYPNTPPFLRPEDLEKIALFGVEVDMPYHDWYDAHALAVDLQPGEWMHWPLNAPHRVENHDCLNVSVTIEYWTDEIRRAHMVNMGNAVLRHRFGMSPKSRELYGPAFWAKAALQRALRNTRWVKQERAARRPITFTLERGAPGSVVPLPMAAE